MVAKLFCWLLGHSWIHIGPHEKFCRKCDKVDTDLDISSWSEEDKKWYLLSIEEERRDIEFYTLIKQLDEIFEENKK